MSETLSLTEGIAQLTAAFARRRTAGGGASDAFFFMVGAGVSAPTVPLAREIERHCLAALRRQPDGAFPDAAIDRYSFLLNSAYPQPVERQELFRSLIERRPISPANFRLAHLLSDPRVPHLVVTTNFDDFLARALSLFGTAHIVSDHPQTAERIDPERGADVQLLHVHGTYWFYDCCNLRAEIEGRAHETAPHRTMASRLARILDRRSPIVIGYSGWEHDVFMSALRQRIESHPLAYNLYWFCHSHADHARLPSWLRDCMHVRFVLPPATSHGGRERAGAVEAEPTLAAGSVLDALIRALDMPVPALTRNPVAFFARHLRASLIQPGEQAADDVYLLESMIGRLDRLAPSWGAAGVSTAARAADPLEGVRDAMRRSQHHRALVAADEIDLDKLAATALRELREMALMAALQLDDDSDVELAGYRLVVETADRLVRDGAPPEENQEAIFGALSSASVVLSAQGRDVEVAATIDEALRRFDDVPARRGELAELLERRALALWRARRRPEELATWDLIARRYGDDPDPELQAAAADALNEKADSLADDDLDAEALAVYEQVVARWTGPEDPDLRVELVRALRGKAFTLGMLDRHAEAIEVIDALDRDFGDVEDVRIQEHVARALDNKSFDLRMLQRFEEAMEVADEIVARYAGKPQLREQVADATVSKSRSLALLGRRAEAAVLLQQLIDELAQTPSLAAALERARHVLADVT